MTRTTVFALVLAAFVIGLTTSATAQTVTAEEKGLPTNSAFSGGDIDQVNLQNGNLHIAIPILSAAQRGGGMLKWEFVYDSETWLKQYIPYVYPNCTSDSITSNAGGGGGTCTPPGFFLAAPEIGVPGGWRLTSPFNWGVGNANAAFNGTNNQIPCPTNSLLTYSSITQWKVVDPEGTAHALPLREESVLPSGTCLGQTLQGPTLDGSAMYFNTHTAVLTLKNGAQIQLTGSGTMGYTGGSQVDPNGNEAGPNDTMNRALVTTTTGPTANYTSPLGAKGTGPGYTLYTVLDSNGTSRQYRVDYALIDLNPDICTVQTFGELPSETCTITSVGNPLVPRMLTLPDGSAYVITYYNNSAGEVQQITLPTGGSISYTYTDFYQQRLGAAGQPENLVGGRAVATRTVTVNGVASQWMYSGHASSPGGGTATVTDPLGNVAVHTFAALTANPGPAVVYSPNVYETSVTYSNSAGTLLRTVTSAYASEYDPVNSSVANARVISRTTTLDNGQTTQKQTDFATFTYACYLSEYCPATATRLDPTAQRDYDYGPSAPGPLLRTTSTVYQSFSIGGTTITKPQTVTVSNGAGTQAAQTVYEYDVYSHANQAMQASGAVQHSASYSTTYTNRSNMTAVSKWRNTDRKMLTATNQYDDAGNLLSVVDPLGYQTSYAYTDAWANTACAPSGQGKLYRTKTTLANGQVTTSTFNSCTGTAASTTVASMTNTTGLPTSLTYDLLNRVSQVTYPDGGLTTYCYSDNPSGACYNATVWSATETDAITSSLNVTHTNIYDGLGRTIHAELTSDPQGTVTTDTVYDGDGRVLQVSNPYRSGDTEYWTTNSYDGIGRVKAVTEADGSVATTVYSGNTTTSADEAGKSRQSGSDALGRLTSVFEDPGSSPHLNYETDYAYDALNNLLSVTQKGGASSGWRVRTFTYDSLSQLLCSASPEVQLVTCPTSATGTFPTGAVTYTYDNDGNVVAKTAPSPNQPVTGTATVTTKYTYDSLNRVTGKSYVDTYTSNAPTASASFGYNGIAPSGCTPPPLTDSYPIGRRTAMCDGSGATSWIHDPMGRVLQSSRTISSVVGKLVKYIYNLDGSVAQSTTSPLKTISYTYNAAERMTAAKDNGDSITFVDGGAYTPIGALATMYYSDYDVTGGPSYSPGIEINEHYNSRLQPLQTYATCQSAATCPSQPHGYVMNRMYNFNLGNGSSGSDNGNVVSITNNLVSVRSQNFTYDSLNRITAGYSTGTNWGETYTIDAWGNLTNIGTYSGKNPLGNLNCAAASTKNQLTACFGYDSAGNMISNSPNTYTYDAENRLIAAGGQNYTYDGDGNRVAKCASTCAPGTAGTFYWRGVDGNTLVESTTAGIFQYEYVFFNGQRVAQRSLTGSEPIYYYFSDHLGTHTIITDGFGNVNYESDFSPYGEEMNITDLTGFSQNYKFTGKERDTESGLDNFGKRYYASSMGRFSSTDPGPYIWRDPQTLNRYTYTRNNPLRYVDPTGMYFVVAAEMQAQVKQYISTMLRSPEGAAMIRAISANPKPNFFSQGALDRHQVPGTNQIAVTNGTTTALAGNQPGQVAGTQTTLSNSNIAFTAGMSTGDIFAVGLKAFAHEDSHVVDINAAHTLQGAAAAGAAGDAPTQPGAENTAGGTAEANALGVMGELGAAGQSFQPNAQTDAQADAIIQGGMQQFGQDQQQQVNQAVQHHGCTSDSEGQHCD